jgi:hypothetical protein
MGDGMSPLFHVSRTKIGEEGYSSQHNNHVYPPQKKTSVKTVSVFAGKIDNIIRQGYIIKFQN